MVLFGACHLFSWRNKKKLTNQDCLALLDDSKTVFKFFLSIIEKNILKVLGCYFFVCNSNGQ